MAALWWPPPPNGEGEVGALQGDQIYKSLEFLRKSKSGSDFPFLFPPPAPFYPSPVLHYQKSKTKVGTYFLADPECRYFRFCNMYSFFHVIVQRQPQTYINKCTWLCFNRTLFEKPGSRSELAKVHSLPASDLKADRAWPRDWHTSQAADALQTGCCIFSQAARQLLLGKDAWRFLISRLEPT